MDGKQILSTRRYKAGYEVRTELIDGKDFGGDDFEMKSAYTPEGDYIGDARTARMLCVKRGIRPAKMSDTANVCSIGWCEKEQKWYGWSHRAMYGFGIGSTVKKGDCAYLPANEQDFIDDALQFWASADEEKLAGDTEIGYDEEGTKGVWVNWTYADTIPNKNLRGQITSHFTPFPQTWGRGEWTAKTLDDAKQMAIDFAESVG